MNILRCAGCLYFLAAVIALLAYQMSSRAWVSDVWNSTNFLDIDSRRSLDFIKFWRYCAEIAAGHEVSCNTYLCFYPEQVTSWWMSIPDCSCCRSLVIRASSARCNVNVHDSEECWAICPQTSRDKYQDTLFIVIPNGCAKDHTARENSLRKIMLTMHFIFRNEKLWTRPNPPRCSDGLRAV